LSDHLKKEHNLPESPESRNSIHGTVNGTSIQAHTINNAYFAAQPKNINPFYIQAQARYKYANGADVHLKSRISSPILILNIKPIEVDRRHNHPPISQCMAIGNFTNADALLALQVDPHTSFTKRHHDYPIEVTREATTRISIYTEPQPITYVEWNIQLEWFSLGLHGSTIISNNGEPYVSLPVDHDCLPCPPF
jgi:hypothetical protein